MWLRSPAPSGSRHFQTVCCLFPWRSTSTWSNPSFAWRASSIPGTLGDAYYAMEELIAEFGAASVYADLGITPEPRADHACQPQQHNRKAQAPPTLREPCADCGRPMRIIEIFRRGQKPMSREPPRQQAA